MNSNKISIIMPVYNGAQTIYNSIASVINQTYVNWELIVIDDGSTDHSVKLVRNFVDDRIKIIANKYNKGAGGARRTGIELSSGDYIAFLDSDDLWVNDKLAHQVEFMKINQVKFSYTDYYIFKDDITSHRIYISPKKINYNDMLKCCNLGCLTVMLETSLAKNTPYVSCYKEDYAYWLKILTKVDFAHKLSGAYSYYRINDGSLSSNKFKEIYRQWYVLRKIENINFLNSFLYVVYYCFNGLVKHFG